MSSELNTVYQSGNTIYAVIRDSNSKVWDTSSNLFVTWANADIADYDIALTDKGGDLYVGNFPSNITIGQYVVSYYVQAGGTPAITDTIITSETINWTGTGSGPVPTALNLDPFALIDLTTAKLYLQIDETDITKDTLLTNLINAATYKIEKECGRNFLARDYVETVFGINESTPVILANSPVVYIDKVGLGRQNSFEIRNTTALRASVAITDDKLRIVTTATSGLRTVTDLPFSVYRTTSDLVNAINALSGYAAVLYLNAPSDELWPVNGIDVTQAQRFFDIIDVENSDIDYEVNENIGAISFYCLPTNTVRVWYKAGFETIPHDLQMICAELVRVQYHMAGKDPASAAVIDAQLNHSITNRAFGDLEDVQLKVLNKYKYVDIGTTI